MSLAEEFSNLGFDIKNDDVSDILEILSKTYKVDPADLAAEWTAYAFNQKMEVLNKDNVELFQRDRYELRKKSTNKRSTPNRKKTKQNFQNSNSKKEAEDQLMDMYSSDSYTTPENDKVQKRTLGVKDPYIPESSPKVNYENRANMNQIVTSFGDNCAAAMTWSPRDDHHLDIEQLQTLTDNCHHIYMYQQFGDQSLAQNERLTRMENYCKQNDIYIFESLMESTQGQVNLVAKICCEGDVRLTEDNISLRTHDNMVMPLDLSCLNEYSFFPGQIVVLEGSNPTGEAFVTKKILETSTLPVSQTALDGDLTIMVSSGPYTTTDNFTYDPLDEFLIMVKENSPAVVIMIGPFVDAKHSQIEELPLTYEELYNQVMIKIASALKDLDVEIIIIPSQRDIHHIPIYPQCPLIPCEEASQIHKMTFMSDPATFNLNGVKISVTSADIIKHMGKHEVSVKTKTSPNRIENLIQQLLRQKCLYPLYPADIDVNMDYNLAKDLISFQDTSPNVLILPSALSCYAKNVNDCLVVNPGYLTRGKSAGMYAKMKLSCRNGSISSQNVEVLRI